MMYAMASPETSVLSFLGDVWLPEPMRSRAELRSPFVFNLEGPITARGRAVPGKINLRVERAWYEETFGRAPLAVCLANNHIADYGPEGFRDTLSALDAAGIGYFGAGTLADNGHNPLVAEVGGRKIALLGYVCPSTHPLLASGDDPGAMPLELPRIGRDVELARQRGAETVVVQLHWGHEHVHLPKPEDVEKARRIVDLGADVVIGHHAHCVQACESYRGKPVFYGLGNAVFPDRRVPSYFGPDGAPSRWFPGAQRYWNKRSLLVEYDTRARRARTRELRFDGGVLYEAGRLKAPPYRLDLGGPGYDKRYARGRVLSALRGAAADFLRKPKLPRLAHLQRLYATVVSNG